ncbi:hypothetical protein BDQ17DRAFT_1399159 [Cyathus striatus]|nr:hypothetical protein BDQ17DRAFT_1399159 [Cyathus striatus]
MGAKISLYPHSTEENCAIVGILEQLEPRQSTHGRKLALILHGTLGHKDYLFQRRLAVRLPFDSFVLIFANRIRVSGNHETGGTWKQGALSDDIEDVNSTYGYVVDLVVGHSRGSIVGFRWLCTSEDGKKSRPLLMHPADIEWNNRLHCYHLDSAAGRAWKASFDKQGYHKLTATVARKQITVRITPDDLNAFTSWDSSLVWDHFPSHTHVLTLHGLSDMTVPPYDALIYSRALGTRVPGTHTLHLMEDADHNFTGRQDEVVDNILDWLEVRERGELRTGIWKTGMKGKL